MVGWPPTVMRLCVSCGIAALLLCGCAPDLGECDIEVAKQVYYTDDEVRLPAYGGQALVEASCGGGAFCHSEAATGPARYGVPAGLDFDVSIAETADQTARLRSGIARVREWRSGVWREVHAGTMPPGEIGEAIRAGGLPYAELPPLPTAEGKEILRNWLACNAPIVERATTRPDGFAPIGDIVAAESCLATPCSGACVDVRSDPANCGSCGTVCEAGTVCAAGACTAGGCPAPTVECSAGCVDTATSRQHCGSCGTVCPAATECIGGTCTTSTCGVGLSTCGSECVDVRTDRLHCGACDRACASGEECAGGSCTACDASVTFAAQVQPVFTARCASSMCHGGMRPQADLSLEAGRSHAELVGVPSGCTDGKLLVAPGVVTGSYLMNKLTGVGICTGMRMPSRAESLSAADLALIRNWICGGARND